jgi:hypothetical protein
MSRPGGAAVAGVATAILVLAAGCVSFRQASATVRPGPEGIYRVDRFRIGWYDRAEHPETPERLARAGFDSVLPYSTRSTLDDVLAFLAAAEKAGIAVHQAIPRAAVADPTGLSLEQYVRATAGNPAVLDWYLYDEPEYKCESRPKLLEAAYFRLKALDPDRNIAIVFVLPGLSGAYRGAMDSLWIDYYPVMRRSREFAALRGGRYADRMMAFGRRADRYGLPLTIVAQGYGENEGGKPQFRRRLPTSAETRYMFWASFLARPEEIVYWSLYRTREVWLQEVLQPVVGEFREMFPDAVEYRPAGGFKVSGGLTDSALLGNGRGGLWLLVLNREGKDRGLAIAAAEGYDFRRGTEAGADEIRRGIGPYGVLLLEVSEAP